MIEAVDMHWDGLSFLASLFAREAEPSRPPETLIRPRIEFLGEQIGAVEDEIKERFCAVFDQVPTVQAAYLARLSYGEPQGYSVALCVRSTTGCDDRLQERLGRVFAAMFKFDQCLDILFLQDDQERDLRKICRPFYEAA